MTQIQKKIYITRGDDTNFNEDKFLKFILNTERDLADWSAMFTLGGNTYKFTDITSKTFEVTISAEDSQKIPYGLNMGSVYLFDNKSRRKTLTISIPFQVEKKPTFNTFSTLEVVAEPVEIQLQVGEPIPTKTSDLVNDSGFITKNVDDLTYYTKTEDMEALIDSKGFITKDVDDLTNYPTKDQINALLETKINVSEKGAENGVATLNEEGVVPEEQLPPVSRVIDDTSVSTQTTYSSENIEDLLSRKANEDNVVHKTGDEIIEGTKSFMQEVKGTITNALAAEEANIAKKATNDGEDRNIVETYATKAELPTELSELNNDTGFINKDIDDLTYYSTAAEVNDLLKGKIDTTEKGVADGVATLGADSKIPLNQLKVIDDISATETTTYSSNKINEELAKKANSSDLEAIVAGQVDDSALVHKETDETINGTKTFTNDIVGNITGIATKATNDSEGNSITGTYATKTEIASKADDSAVVHNTGAETISGTKTFVNDLTAASLILTNPITTISVNNETFIRNTSTGETVISNLSTSTNSMCFRPNGTDNSEGQVLINKDGTITGNLAGNATTATQANSATNDSEGNSIVNTYANQEFSNLGEEAENRLTITKAYLADNIYTDTKLYNQLLQQKTNLAVGTGNDIIKEKNFSVIGNSVVSVDGIANSFAKGSAIKTNISVTPVNSIEVQGIFKYTESVATVVPYVVGNSRWRLDITKNENGLSVYATNDLEVSTNTRFNISINNAIEDGTIIEIKDKISKNKREVQIIINDTTYSGESTFANEIPFSETSVTIGSAALDGQSDYFWSGSVDLNTVKVFVDDLLFYQACLIIPYTVSKTGSKIVDGKYRERVFDLYEQEGMAIYYVLDTDSHNFTLPLGDVYGMITKLFDRVKVLESSGS